MSGDLCGCRSQTVLSLTRRDSLGQALGPKRGFGLYKDDLMHNNDLEF